MSTKNNKLRFIDEEKQRNYKKIGKDMENLKLFDLDCWFCDFCVISIILLYFIDFKFLSKWLWIFMEEVIYNYKTCDRWWQNRRNFYV